tara:strand:+ start:216 stop:515 length:300 start_codon:yes stop_codon:yes gene_type:complete
MSETPGIQNNKDSLPSAAPSQKAKYLAFIAILISGLCGGTVGYSVTKLQCEGSCLITAGIIGTIAAVLAAIGVSIVTVLAMRAMAEWQTNQRQQDTRNQ